MTDTATKIVPKSLHTITVLTQLVRYISDAEDLPYTEALERAVGVLGFEDKQDIHGLVAKAAKQLGITMPMNLTAPRGWSHTEG